MASNELECPDNDIHHGSQLASHPLRLEELLGVLVELDLTKTITCDGLELLIVGWNVPDGLRNLSSQMRSIN